MVRYGSNFKMLEVISPVFKREIYMVKIEAVVRKEKLADVCKVLERSGIGGLTVSDVRGFGHHRGGLQEKAKIEIYADEFQVETISELIRDAAKTGVAGDGNIVILNIENIYRISTGEEGAAAI